jgi:tetratricopeptide (TPR) repeat protein
MLGLLLFEAPEAPAQTTAKEWFDKGKSFQDSKKYTEAESAYKKAVLLKPDYTEALHELGWCYNEQAMYNEALDALKKEEKNSPKDKAQNYFEIGYSYKMLTEYDEALSYLTKATSLDPNYGLAYKEIGNCYFSKKEYQKALDNYNKYRDLKPEINDSKFYYNKGWCENELGLFSDATMSLRKSTDLDNTNSIAYSELGYAYYKLKFNDEAISNYQKAIALNKADHASILGIADTYYDNLKNYDSAMAYYERGVRLTQKNKGAYYRLGWCYNDKERFKDAVFPLQQALLLDPEYAKARTDLGYSYYKLKDYDNALSQFRNIMEKDSKDELSRYYAGFCYYLKGDQPALQKVYNELKELGSKYAETLSKYIK